MTLTEAQALSPGQTLYHGVARNADGTPQRFRVTGRVRTWARDPGRVEIPTKRGMYETHTITEHDLKNWHTSEEDALRFGEIRAEVPPLEEKEERKIHEAKDLFVYALRQGLQQSAERAMHFLVDEGHGSWVEMTLDRWKRKLPPFRKKNPEGNPGDPQMAMTLLGDAEHEISQAEIHLANPDPDAGDAFRSIAARWAHSAAGILQDALQEIHDLPPGPRMKTLLDRHSSLRRRLQMLQNALRQAGVPPPIHHWKGRR